MIELKGDLWTRCADWAKPLWVVVPTNGETKANGHAVMGAGVAKQAALRFPDLPKLLGEALRKKGNRVHLWRGLDPNFDVVTFPTKTRWAKASPPDLVAVSARQLYAFAVEYQAKTVVLPRVATGLGGLSWAVVKIMIQDVLLDDVELERYFVVVSP